jgi:hypothetical protein
LNSLGFVLHIFQPHVRERIGQLERAIDRVGVIAVLNTGGAQRAMIDEAFGKLVKEIGKTFASQPPKSGGGGGLAMVHGLATLILEGSLARKVGVPKLQQKRTRA